MFCIFIVQIMLWPWFLSSPPSSVPPSVYCFHADAQTRLAVQSTADSLYQHMLLTHNLAFNKYEGMRDRSDQLLKLFEKQYGSSDSTIIYRATLDIMYIRDHQFKQYASGTVDFFSFGLFGSNPKDKVRKAVRHISECVERDTASVTLRLHRLTVALETAEHLDDMLAVAAHDLQWLGERVSLLDTAEACLYRLAWARYAHKYCTKLKYLPAQSRINELNKGLQWVASAHNVAVTPGLKKEVSIWEERLTTLRSQLEADSP